MVPLGAVTYTNPEHSKQDIYFFLSESSVGCTKKNSPMIFLSNPECDLENENQGWGKNPFYRHT